jgi:hypothetical protein
MASNLTATNAPLARAVVHLAVNGVIFLGMLLFLKASNRKQEIPTVGAPRPVAVPPKAATSAAVIPPQPPAIQESPSP